MASSDNLMTMIEQPWSFRTTFADSSWTTFPDMFHIKETETLTQALHRTISNDDSPLSRDESDNNVFLLPLESGTAAAFPVPTDNVSKQNKKSTVGGPTGRVTKRKSRASKRQATTFIAADPANFREMVQQVTGVRFGVGGGLPAAADLMRPEPQRPTFDGSGFLLGGSALFVQPRQVGSVGDDLDSLCSFPTLESSKVHF